MDMNTHTPTTTTTDIQTPKYAGKLYVNLTQVGVIREERTSIERMPP